MLADYLGFPRTVYVLCAGTFINRAATFLIPFLTLYLRREHGLSVNFATLAMGAFGAGSIGGTLLGGYLADRIGRRPVMLLSLSGAALVLRFFGDITTPAGIIAAIVIFTVVGEMYRPAASAMMADLVPPERRPHAFSIMYVAINLGFGLGAYVGGRLATLWFTWLFWVDAATTGLYALVIVLLISETLPARTNTRGTVNGNLDPGDSIAGDATPVSALSAFQHVLADRTFIALCAGALLCGLVFMQAMSTFPLYLSERGLTPDVYGKLISINGWMIALCQLPFTALLSRFHRGWVITLAAVVLAVGFGAKGLAGPVWQFQLTVVVWTIGEMMQASMMMAVVTDMAPTHLRARYLGVFSMCFSSANMLGAPLGGLVLAQYGGRVLWSSAFVVAVMAAGLFALIRNRLVVTRAYSD